MAKKDEHALTDRWARGRANPQRGIGAYTHSRTGVDSSVDDNTGKVDRSESPSKKAYGSMHYPATKDG